MNRFKGRPKAQAFMVGLILLPPNMPAEATHISEILTARTSPNTLC